MDMERRLTRRARPGLLALSVAALCAAPGASAADWEFEPRASVGLTWLDNVDLAPSGLEESETVFELKPGFLLQGSGPRVDARLDYDAQGLWFSDKSDLDDVYHQANGRATFVVMERQLFIDGSLRFDQQNIDPSRSLANSNFVNSSNRADTLVYAVSPYHVGRWGSRVESLLRVRHQGVRYSNFDRSTFRLEDADTNSASLSLGSPRDRRGFSWRVNGSTSTTEYETAPDFAYDRVSLDLGVPVGLRTRLTATAGQESDFVADREQGGLDESFWYVGAQWQPSELQSLEIKVGDRYYGNAYEVRWSRRGSRGTLGLDYTEEPTTSSGVLGDDDVFQPGFRPGGLPGLDTRVFLRKRLSGRAGYEFARSRLGFRVFSEERVFEEGDTDSERNHGLALSYDWQLAARMNLGVLGEWEQRQFAGQDREDDLVELGLRLSRQLTRSVSTVLAVSRFARDSNVDGAEYEVNRVSLNFEARF